MIKTIIFDLGGVIVPLDFPRAYSEIASYTPHPPDEIRRRIAATDLYLRAEMGRMTPDEFIREMSATLDLTANEAEFRRVWCSIFPPRTLIGDALIERLHQRHRVLMLSNTNSIHFDWIRDNYPILRHFDDFILSFELGLMKPGPEIYAEAVRRAGCLAEECFYTDDLEENVAGARRAGLDAVRFIDEARLRGELAGRRVL